MEHPQDRPAPTKEQPILRVKEYARDLAYGALIGWWSAELPQSLSKGDALFDLHKTKWKDDPPHWDLLTSFGYLLESGGPGARRYILAPKSYELLETIAQKTSVFISYGRKKSSAFALAIKYKLLSLGVAVFLDMDIDLGDDWHARLERKIKECDYFVMLLTPGVLKSRTIQKEISWARESHRICIPIWHANFSAGPEIDINIKSDLSTDIKKYISKNACIIDGNESALKYHEAIDKLINRL